MTQPIMDPRAALQKVLSRSNSRPGRPPVFTPELAQARNKERQRRAAVANRFALQALRDMYPEVYRELYLLVKDQLAQEFGPLPGDEF